MSPTCKLCTGWGMPCVFLSLLFWFPPYSSLGWHPSKNSLPSCFHAWPCRILSCNEVDTMILMWRPMTQEAVKLDPSWSLFDSSLRSKLPNWLLSLNSMQIVLKSNKIKLFGFILNYTKWKEIPLKRRAERFCCHVSSSLEYIAVSYISKLQDLGTRRTNAVT